MKSPRSVPLLSAAVCLAGLTASRADDVPPFFERDLVQDRHRLSIAARFSFGISARVNFTALPPLAEGNYHDGFVRPDSNGGADGQTWHWSYVSDSQIVGDVLELHRVTALPSDERTAGADDGVQAGFEVLYGRELGRFNVGRQRATWGLEAGISSLNPKLETRDTFRGLATVLADRFALGEMVPPLAPYTGTVEGPGPLLGLEPADSRLDQVSAVSETRAELDALLVGLKLGPFLEVPLGRKFQLHLGAGVAALATFGDFTWTEQPRVPGIEDALLRRRASDSDTGFEVGGYAQAGISWAATDFLSLYAGGQYQYLGDLTLRAGGREARLEFSGAFELVAGLRTSF